MLLPRRILLWDIDGTLVDNDHAGLIAMNRTFRAMFEFEKGLDPLDGIDFAGASDRWIVRRVAQSLGIEWDEAQDAAFIDRYEEILREVLHERAGRVLPGVEAVLEALAQEDVVQGLGTGNFRRSAFVKLDHYGLGEHFVDGGFGDDSPNRPELLAVGLERMRTHADAGADCVVVGDTVHDITAGHAIGARVVAVSTGFNDRERLREAGPEVLLDDLADIELALAAVLG